MCQTQDTKQQIFMFLPRLKDKKTNKGVADELKITRDCHFVPMTIQTSVTHLLHALIIKVTDGATVTSELCASELLFMTH